MKKHLFGLLVIAAAVSFSAFTSRPAGAGDDLYYWFDQTDHSLIGSTTTLDDNIAGCDAQGNNCVKVYRSATPLSAEPSGQPTAQFSFNP